MTRISKILASGAGIAALMAAAPAAAQYYGQPYGQAYGYGYAQPYGNAYGYQQNQWTQMAAQQCAAAVQSRLQNRGVNSGLSGVLGAVLGANTMSSARVLNITQVNQRRSTIRVRGLATSGRYAGGYSPYGVGAYGSSGYAFQPDLSFKCEVDFNGRIRDLDIDRR